MAVTYPTPVRRILLAPSLLLVFAWQMRAAADEWLTDDDVMAMLARGSPGVFYAWSPHMPLSVDGLQEILTAGERLGLDVIPVLSPHTSMAYARDRIDGKALPEAVLRQTRSAELVRRNLFVHAPAILVFDRGRFVSPVLPGFRTAADYEHLIGRFLERDSR
jgi:hypothetical protein